MKTKCIVQVCEYHKETHRPAQRRDIRGIIYSQRRVTIHKATIRGPAEKKSHIWRHWKSSRLTIKSLFMSDTCVHGLFDLFSACCNQHADNQACWHRLQIFWRSKINSCFERPCSYSLFCPVLSQFNACKSRLGLHGSVFFPFRCFYAVMLCPCCFVACCNVRVLVTPLRAAASA